MKRIITLAMAALAVCVCNAAVYKVRAAAADSTGTPESYATVKIYSLTDSVKPVATGVTADDGRFDRQLAAPGRYRLTLYSIGKTQEERAFEVTEAAPVADLGTITLRDAENVLGEVVVEATRPLVSLEVDRIGYDVQADDESKTTMLDEMLRKVPLVSVEADGTIKVNGSTDFKIYKNGRPNNSFTRNAKDIFKALPAATIEKIEVITEPGAREDAEGVSAILNIVTLKNTVMKGAMGNISVNYSTAGYLPNPNVWLSAQYDKFAMSFYGGLNSRGRHTSKNSSTSETLYEQTGNTLRSESEGSGSGLFGYYGAEGSWEPDTLNLLTFEFGGYHNRSKNDSYGTTWMLSRSGEELYRYSNRSRTDPSNWGDFNGSVNYQRSTSRKGESLILSYRVSNNTTSGYSESYYEDWTSLPVPYKGIISDSHENGIEHTVQVDWTRPFAKVHTLDVGGKYIYRDNHSTSEREYIDYRTDNSNFKHITQVAALFADYRLNLGKFGARAGVRYEYSHLAAKYPDGSENPFSADLGDWVPNVGIIYNPTRSNSLKLSFGSRIQRPGINYLNPSVNESPNYTSQGNPDLESVRKNSFTFNYNYMGRKLTVGFTSTYGFSSNDIISVERIVGDHRYVTYGNEGRLKSFSASGYANWRPTTKTSLMLNGSVRYENVHNPSLGQKSHGWGNNLFGRFAQDLPWDINLSVYASTWTSPRSLYSKFRASGWGNVYWGVALRKSFLKERRLSVNLQLQNPFHTKNPGYISTSDTDGFHSRSFSRSYNRTAFVVSVGYRFGKMTASVKKVSKGIQNDDVVGGSSNGGSGNEGGNGSSN